MRKEERQTEQSSKHFSRLVSHGQTLRFPAGHHEFDELSVRLTFVPNVNGCVLFHNALLCGVWCGQHFGCLGPV